MRRICLSLVSAAAAAVVAGCLQVQPQPPVPPASFSSWSPMGGFSMTSGANCAGRATLDHGSSVVSDSCFTGVDNVVLCTDTTTAAPVGCAPASGSLTITGTGTDTIAYARVR